MRIKLLSALLVAGAATAMAQQGFKDGIEYFNAGYIDEAEIILNKNINDPSVDKAQADYYLGMVAIQRGDAAKAKQYFDNGIAANANYPNNYTGLGYLSLKAGNKSEAQGYFATAEKLAKSKKDAAAYIEIARAYFNTNPTAYANDITKLVEKAKKADKSAPSIYIFEGDQLLAKDQVGDAAGFYEMAMEFDKADGNIEYPESYVKYAQFYTKLNPTVTVQRLQELLSQQPNSAMAQRELAETYYINDQFTPAAEQYGKYIQNPNAFQKDRQRYVGLLNYGKKYQESFDLATQILSEDPGNIYMQRMQFINQAALKNPAEAAKYAEVFFANPKAQGKFVRNDFTTYGEVLQDLGQDTLAVVQYQKAVELDPTKAQGYSDLSGAYTKAKMYGDAVKAYQKYIDMEGVDNISTNDLFNLARRYQNAAATAPEGSAERDEYINGALTTIDAVLAKVPDNPTVMMTKARILYVKNGQKNDEASIDAFKQTVALLDQDPENITKKANDYITCYNQIGNYYLEQKDNAQAKYYFTKFLEVDPTNEALREFVEKLK